MTHIAGLLAMIFWLAGAPGDGALIVKARIRNGKAKGCTARSWTR